MDTGLVVALVVVFVVADVAVLAYLISRGKLRRASHGGSAKHASPPRHADTPEAAHPVESAAIGGAAVIATAEAAEPRGGLEPDAGYSPGGWVADSSSSDSDTGGGAD